MLTLLAIVADSYTRSNSNATVTLQFTIGIDEQMWVAAAFGNRVSATVTEWYDLVELGDDTAGISVDTTVNLVLTLLLEYLQMYLLMLTSLQ